MTALNIDGAFYIDNVPCKFYLREDGTYNYKGKMIRANIFGLWTAPLFPFKALQQFGCAPADRDITYDPDFSGSYSSVTCTNRPVGEAVVSFTDDLSAFLGYGERLICTATFAPGEDVAALTFNTITVPGGRPIWAIMPASADANFCGVVALIGGQG